MACSIIVGDCLTRLRDAPDRSVHMAVTSPPYHGLRSYIKNGEPEKKSEIGNEKSVSEYVNNLIAVFAQVHRVLRDDGVFWLNIANRRDSKTKQIEPLAWKVAMAMQDFGWILRSDCIWCKENTCPSSAKDRPTTIHEYLFLFSKKASYFYDYAAIREKGVCPAGTKGGKGSATRAAIDGVNARPPKYKIYDGMRNKRSVWRINTRPAYKGMHVAVYPPELVEPCILAGTSAKGVCPSCLSPWHRIHKKTGHVNQRERSHVPGKPTKVDSTGWEPTTVPTDEWEPDCSCGCDATERATVLDPFAGSGTTGLVAEQLGRNSILIELSRQYAESAKERIGEAATVFHL